MIKRDAAAVQLATALLCIGAFGASCGGIWDMGYVKPEGAELSWSCFELCSGVSGGGGGVRAWVRARGAKRAERK